jgi:predicted nucleotidyltransferase
MQDERCLGLDIEADHLEMVLAILKKHLPDREVWVFGSRAKGKAKRYSDIDLCVIGDAPLSLTELAGLSDDFSESDLPYKVDVVDWATTSDSFREIIKRDKKVLVKAPPEFLNR